VTCDSTTAVAWQQLCGHVVSLATKEHAVVEEMFTVRSVTGLYNEGVNGVIVETGRKFKRLKLGSLKNRDNKICS
jgi:hypothetical protein